MPARIPDEELLEDLRDFYEETGEISPTIYQRDWDGYNDETIRKRFGTWGEALSLTGVENGYDSCPYEDCYGKFSKLGNHWQQHPSHRPEITERQHEILSGFLMGDGSMSMDEDRNPHFQSTMTSKQFLEWLDNEMGVLGRGVKFHMSAEDAAKQDRESGFNPDAKAENYKDRYRWGSRRHPYFEVFSDWYSTGQKRFPDDLQLTPLILKVWFCCDGSLKKPKNADRQRPVVSIGCSNESDRREYLADLFSEIGVSPDFYRNKRKGGGYRFSIVFGVDDSEYLWDYMGDPLPDFEYKWPSDDDFQVDKKEWSEEEISILKRKYPSEGSFIKELDRSRNSIKTKANLIGIRYGDSWTDEELRILREEYPSNGVFIDSLDRTRGATKQMAHRIGVSYEGD